MSTTELPALLGGRPERPAPLSPPNFIGPQERALVDEVLATGVLSDFVAHQGPSFNGGRMVKALEGEFCERFDVRHAVSVNSAASGLHAAVAAALVGPGDEVIVPAYTMSATATAVAIAGGTPVFADIRADTFCLDVEDVRRKLSPRTRAIIAVNLFGLPADLFALRELADKHGLVLIEDNAQGPGATLRGRHAGTIGHMGVFSFNCHKTIQCGEGGVVTTDNATLDDRMRLVRNHGEVVLAQREQVPDELLGMLGFNYRLTELQAAVALAQVRRLEELTAPRIAMANAITEGLRGIEGLTPAHVPEGARHVYYVYPIRVDAARLGLSRAHLHKALLAENLPVAAGYVKPIYLYPMYDARVRAKRTGFGAGLWHPEDEGRVRYGLGACPVTEQMHFHELLSTPICRADLSVEDARGFVRAVRRVLEHRDAVRAHLSAQNVA